MGACPFSPELNMATCPSASTAYQFVSIECAAGKSGCIGVQLEVVPGSLCRTLALQPGEEVPEGLRVPRDGPDGDAGGATLNSLESKLARRVAGVCRVDLPVPVFLSRHQSQGNAVHSQVHGTGVRIPGTTWKLLKRLDHRHLAEVQVLESKLTALHPHRGWELGDVQRHHRGGFALV